MPKSHKEHKFILCVIDEMTNYLITVPIYHARSEEIGAALIDSFITIWHTRVHNNGSRYCIYVHTHELPVKKVTHKK